MEDKKKQEEELSNEYVRRVAEQKYEFGFTTDVHTEIIDKGLNEEVIHLISQKKGEPQWLLDFRLKAFAHWKEMETPDWGHLHLPPRWKRPSTSWEYPWRNGLP